MDFLKKLDNLMIIHGLNKHTLSMRCGIPYTTIDAWYKKGYSNAKLSTIQKLADFFGVTIDYLMREEITDINYGLTKNAPEPAATDSEATLRRMQLLINSFEAAGYVRPGEDLTDEQLRFCMALVDFLDTYFSRST